MVKNYFEYLKKKSNDYGLAFLKGQTISSATFDDANVEIPGRDGFLTMSNKRYKSANLVFKCNIYSKTGIQEAESKIANWLLSDVGWHNLTWSEDPGFTYIAKIDGGLSIERLGRTYGNVDISFLIQPNKFLNEGQSTLAIKNGQTLTNKGTLPAKPLIKITGSGDIKLTIGSTEFDLRKVDQGIILDCESQTATSLDGKRTQFDKLYSNFGAIHVGNNKISWTGSATVEITPRWAVIA